MTNFVQLVAEFPLDSLRLTPVGRAGGLLVTDAVDPDVGPPLVAALVERHRLSSSFPLLLKNPLDDLIAIEHELARRA
jgi:hypothetical protein